MSQMTNGVIIKQLSPEQIKRLNRFTTNLQESRDPCWFDDKVRDVARRYELYPGFVDSVSRALDAKTNEEGLHFSRSHYDYAGILKAVEKFSEPHAKSIRFNPNYQSAIEKLKKYFRRYSKRMIHYSSDDDIRDTLPKLDTHSGWTFIETGLRDKGENLVGVKDKVMQLEDAAKVTGNFNRIILPGHRSQGNPGITDDGEILKGFKLKTRLVMMVDLLQIVSELRFAAPVQDAFALWNQYAGGKSDIEQSRRIMEMRMSYRHAISIDYSAFDQSLPGWLIEDCFDILKCMFERDETFDEQLWSVIVNSFIHKQLLLDSGVVTLHDGVPSGSMFTQIIDSLANKLMVETAFNVIAGGRHDCFIMGDDNLIYYHECDVDRLLEVVHHLFGVTVNMEKSGKFDNGEDPEFLSRYWRKDGKTWRQPKILVSCLLYPERKRNYSTSATPELVLYSYILSYRGGMEEWFDVSRFLQEHNFKEIDLVKAPTGTLPGYLEYVRRYGGVIAA